MTLSSIFFSKKTTQELLYTTQNPWYDSISFVIVMIWSTAIVSFTVWTTLIVTFIAWFNSYCDIYGIVNSNSDI